jgi:uncharacterized cupredoxin-like copper-binding protein
MNAFFRAWPLWLALLPLVGYAQTGARPDPADPSMAVPTTKYESVFGDYRPYKDQKVGPWKQVLDEVAGLPGAAGHAGHGGNAIITVKRGETIKFVVKNTGKMKHEMVLGTLKELKEHAALMQKFPEMEHADPNQISVDPGKTGELIWQFTKAGTFDFACLQPGHFEAGMVGKVAVK